MQNQRLTQSPGARVHRSASGFIGRLLLVMSLAAGVVTGCTSGTAPAAAPPKVTATPTNTTHAPANAADSSGANGAHATANQAMNAANAGSGAGGTAEPSGSVGASTPGTKTGTAIADPPKSQLVPVVIARNVDGDTIHVILPNGRETTVRMLLIDTPETVDPEKPVEPYGPQASAFAKQKLPVGKHVYLEEGAPGSQTDKYGRLLAYVYITPTDMYNEDVVRAGLARVAYVYEPNTQHLAALRQDEAYAKAHRLGIWSIPGYATEDGYNLAAAGAATTGSRNPAGSGVTAGSSGGTASTAATQGSHASPAGASSSTALRIVASDLDVARGGEASVTIQTKPGATGHIVVRYKSGPSHAKGLTDKTADASGRITWTWTVGSSTTPGDWPITITSDGQTVETSIHVR